MTLLVHPKEPALFWLNLHINQKTSMFFAFGQSMVVREQLDSAHLFCRYFLSQYIGHLQNFKVSMDDGIVVKVIGQTV